MEENEIEIKVVEKKECSLIKVDLKNKNLTCIDTNSLISPNITELYLSNNSLKEVPAVILNLNKIRILDLSFNNIEYFDATPKFCDTIEYLNIANNKLLGPPYWVWAANPAKLIELNLSSNSLITRAFQHGYLKELLQYQSIIKKILIYNCNIKNHAELLKTFPNVNVLEFGTSKPKKSYNANRTEEVLWKVLENCDIEIINLSNTSVFEINTCIGIYKNLREIDLSFNEISKLPEEFCDLENLEMCVLSHNYIMYLPERFYKLEKLTILAVDNNELCMLPDISKLPCLIRLDVYNNFLYEEPNGLEKLIEVDMAMNYFEEPNNEEYVSKKLKLRTNRQERYDGRKELVNSTQYSDREHSCSTTDDDLEMRPTNEDKDLENRSLSSPEDWDSDDYWVPHISPKYDPPQSPWIFFVKQKMTEGNFCPFDAHMVPIADQVKYDKLCNPTIEYEVDGQFDDLSEDNS